MLKNFLEKLVTLRKQEFFKDYFSKSISKDGLL